MTHSLSHSRHTGTDSQNNQHPSPVTHTHQLRPVNPDSTCQQRLLTDIQIQPSAMHSKGVSGALPSALQSLPRWCAARSTYMQLQQDQHDVHKLHTSFYASLPPHAQPWSHKLSPGGSNSSALLPGHRGICQNTMRMMCHTYIVPPWQQAAAAAQHRRVGCQLFRSTSCPAPPAQEARKACM